MSIKKFIKQVRKILQLDNFESRGKKKSLKVLLEKLEARKKVLRAIPRKELDIKEKKSLKEEEEIISLQIKKGKEILDSLDT
jgi:hypothetical protein